MKKLLILILLIPSICLAAPERFNFEPITCVNDLATGITTATTTLVVDGTASKELVLYKVYLQNIGATTTLVTLAEESGAAFYSVHLVENQPASFTTSNKVLKFATDKGLNITTDAAGDIRWTVCIGLE